MSLSGTDSAPGIERWRRHRNPRHLSIVTMRLRRAAAFRKVTRHSRSAGLSLIERDPLAALGDQLQRRFGQLGAGGGSDHRLRAGRCYLVTGCAGFIGSHLVEALRSRGCAVVGVDAFIDNYPRALKERNLERCAAHSDLEFKELDLAEAPLQPLLARVDGIFHLAARPGVRTSWGPSFAAYDRDNVLATQRVFEAAVERGVRIVYASSSSVYGNAASYPVREDSPLAPVSPYGVTKLAGEALANAFRLSHGLDAVGLRYFSVYGPRQRPDMAFARVLRCLEEGRPFQVLGRGLQTREYTYVGDVVEATLAAMDRAPSGRVYNIGGGSEISLLRSLKLCESVVGRRLDVQYVPAAAGDPWRTSASIRRARAELGWRPTTPLEAGLLAQVRDAARVEEPQSQACAAAG
jgi:UDP-glucuronate 4-epimerase